MKNEQIKDILAHFKGVQINQTTLTEYCNLKHYNPMVMSQFEDCRYQQEHDERVQTALPFIFAELAKFQYTPTYLSDSEVKAMKEANDDIEWKISKVLEDNGIHYKEIDLITKNLGSALQVIMENAGGRANNMCAVVLSTLAKEKFGDPLILKPLAEYYREKAKELGIKLHKDNEPERTL